MKVTLTPSEIAVGTLVGQMRHDASVARGYKDQHGFRGNSLEIHISGALGEMAAAKALKKYWGAGVNTFHAADIEPDIQVRTTRKLQNQLVIRPSDNLDHIFVSVVDQCPDFIIRGCVIGTYAAVKENWQTYGGRPGAWFVPEEQLVNFRTLMK